MLGGLRFFKMTHANALELEARVKEMAQYYFDGFQAYLSGVLGSASLYLRDGKKKYKIEADDFLRQIEKFYERINPESAQLNDSNASLLVVKLLLPQVRTTLNRFFNIIIYHLLGMLH